MSIPGRERKAGIHQTFSPRKNQPPGHTDTRRTENQYRAEASVVLGRFLCLIESQAV